MTRPIQVVYLFGAGATHACVKNVESAYGILMRDLGEPLRDQVHNLVADKYQADPVLVSLANSVIDEQTDYEHIITFLDESASALHRRFAEDLRAIFEDVLREKLRQIEEEQGRRPVDLYEAVLDMHDVPKNDEEIRGILTLNYDEYIESAIRNFDLEVDFGVWVEGIDTSGATRRLIKLHGSFGWQPRWPIAVADTDASPLWIPPGIQKSKDGYPFNLLWGRAREILDCDVLRIVGCNLGPNDWDLISLIFTTCHTNASRSEPYRVEIINSPKTAAELRRAHPYLNIKSILETDPAGPRLISELAGKPPAAYEDFSQEEREELDAIDEPQNWFRLWLVHTAEGMFERIGSLTTDRNVFEGLLEAI